MTVPVVTLNISCCAALPHIFTLSVHFGLVQTVLTEMKEICQGNVFGRLRAQTEARNIRPESKKVLRAYFWQGLYIVLLCVFVKD